MASPASRRSCTETCRGWFLNWMFISTAVYIQSFDDENRKKCKENRKPKYLGGAREVLERCYI